MLLLLLFIVFIVAYILNYMNDNNYHPVSVMGEIRPEKSEEIKSNELISLLNSISSADKVILDNITEKWIMTKDIIDEKLNEDIKGIIKEVVGNINRLTEYTFFVNNIENMFVMKDLNGNYRCILNCFIFEVSKYYTIKLSMDIVSYDEEIFFNSIDIDESSLSTILNKYDIKWDGMGILSKHNMFSENVKDILDNY